jgi:hypothetical protein
MNKGEDMRKSAVKMLRAMKQGYQVTPMNGPRLCSTTAVSQRFQELRDHPSVTEVITSERVTGERYHRYYIKGALNTATRQPDTEVPVKAHVRKYKTSFDDQPSFGW